MPKKSPKLLFHKLFYSYTAVIVCIVTALVVFFISATMSRSLQTDLGLMRMMSEDALTYVEECSGTADNVLNDLYRYNATLDDLLQYLSLDDEAYWNYRLNTYSSSSSLSYLSVDGYLKNVIRNNPEIQCIEAVSYGKKEVTSFFRESVVHRSKNPQERLDALERGTLAAEGELCFQKELRTQSTLQSVGCLIITFDTKKFTSIKDYYSKADMLVYSEPGTAVYQSTTKFPAGEVFAARREGRETDYLRAHVQTGSIKGYTVLSFLENSRAGQLPLSVFFTILGLGVVLVIAGEALVDYHLKRLTKRLNYILDGMDRVTLGNLDVSLDADENGDELDVISLNFNEMCRKLNRYIQKSYLAEIEQKNAELETLTNQINPHFLYNTLEAIRMKAISNGDRDVGKMLYIMAVVFRSQLKEADIITVAQELQYCEKYLELFAYRYQGKFTSHVKCPEDMMGTPIIKLILQPVLENYFIHGIRAQETGNEIWVSVEQEENALLIHVSDNGIGMDDADMDAKNRELQENKPETRQTIGLMNVNRRIRAVYGEGFGVSLLHREQGGLHIVVRVGLGEELQDDKSHAG